jgi:6-hydroxycyclohex-1-ene-1-carbonyl-CoA dehydrogenase
MNTMKAAILKENHQWLVIEDVAIPSIKPDEVLVRVKACGVCHTDLHYIDHGVKTFKELPLILGHEASGIIIETGKDVTNLPVETRVVIPAVLTCGSCIHCKSARENICQNMKMPGNHIDGAYAEYITVPAKDLIPLPDKLSYIEGALSADALSTAYHAVYNRTNLSNNQTALIIGCGGVGMSVLQMALTKTVNVIAVDINDEKLKIAQDLGACLTINPATTDVAKALKTASIKTFDIIFEVTGLPANLELALKLAKYGTTICIVGYMKEKVTLNPAKVMFMEQNIIGSLGCRPKDLVNVFKLIKNQKINTDIMISQTYPLKDINKALDDLRFARALRSVIVFD